MPAALSYGTINTEAWKSAELAYATESIARSTQAAKAWKYYDGDHPQSLKLARDKVDDNIVVNLIGLLVDKGVSGLFGTTESEVDAGVKFDLIDQPGEPGFVDPAKQPGFMERVGGMAQQMGRVIGTLMGREQEEEPQANPAQDYLNSVWRANKKNILLHDVGFFGSLLGHVFVKLVPDGITDPETGLTCTRLINLDPASVCVYWDGNDYDRVLWYRVQYAVGNLHVRQDIVRGTTEDEADSGQWLIYNYERRLEANKSSYSPWTLTSEEAWPYPFAPIVDWKNLPRPKSYYGADDISQNAMSLNRAINFIFSNIARIIKFHAHPKTVGTGFKAEDVKETAVNSLWTVPDPNAKVYNLEMMSDMSSSLNFAAMLRSALFDGAREADPESIRSKLGQLSNFDLRVLFQDVLAKGGTKRLLYGDGLTRLNRCLLALGKFNPQVKMVVEWPDPLPSDPVAQTNALKIDVETGGLSQSTYLEKRGYDPDQEAQRRETEAFEASMNAPAGGDPVEMLMRSLSAPAPMAAPAPPTVSPDGAPMNGGGSVTTG